MELTALIGIGVLIIGVGIGLATLIVTGMRSLRTDMSNLRAEMLRIEARLEARIDELRAWTEAQFKKQSEEIVALRERVSYLVGLLEGRASSADQRSALAGGVAEGKEEYGSG